MEEAKYSFNIKFRMIGFDCQFTLRDDESGGKLLVRGKQVIESLLAQGAVPNGNHQPSLSVKGEAEKRVCPVCGRDDKLELIDLGEKYDHRKAWKCQRCMKWLPNGK